MKSLEFPIIPHSSSLTSKPSSTKILESISPAFSNAVDISDLFITLEMPRDDPELDGLTKIGNFNFFKISLITLFLTCLL